MIIPLAARGVLIENGNRSRNGESDHYPVLMLNCVDGCRYLLTEIDDTDTDLIYGLKDYGDGRVVQDYFSIPLLEAQGRRGQIKRVETFMAMGPLSYYAEEARALVAA